jgi:hypothetical protein
MSSRHGAFEPSSAGLSLAQLGQCHSAENYDIGDKKARAASPPSERRAFSRHGSFTAAIT